MIEPNEPLLREVQKLILEEPKRMDMARLIMPLESVLPDRRPACGTVGCVYGWAYAVLHGQEQARAALGVEFASLDDELSRAVLGPGFVSLDDDGDDNFDIDEADSDDKAQDSLIYVEKWPERFRLAIVRFDPGSPEYAQVVSDRIDSFIASKGQDWRE